MSDLRARTMLLSIAGSHAHGTATEASDIDVVGAALPTRREALGLYTRFEQTTDLGGFEAVLRPDERERVARTKLEGTVFALGKLLLLAADANPNMLEFLFTRPDEVRIQTDRGLKLRDARALFVTDKCRHTFGGYALNQLSRIQLHYRWHREGPVQPPSRGDFGLPEQTLIPREQLDAAESAIRDQISAWDVDLSNLDPDQRIALTDQISRSLAEQQLTADDRWLAGARTIGLDDNLIEVMQQERRWRSARTHYRNYRRWLDNRNPERAALEAQHGYDTKHGAHLVRLLRMGVEIVTTGEVHVWRGDRDADELRAIRNGAWSYEALCEYAESTRQALANAPRTLPPRPDRDRVEDLYLSLLEYG